MTDLYDAQDYLPHQTRADDLIDRKAAIARFSNSHIPWPPHAIRDTLAALPAVAPGVRVKPLVWTRADEDDGVPQWVSGRYFVRYTAAGYKLRIDGWEMPKRYLGNAGDEAAKADAQKDHDTRILAALDTPAPAMELVEAGKALAAAAAGVSLGNDPKSLIPLVNKWCAATAKIGGA